MEDTQQHVIVARHCAPAPVAAHMQTHLRTPMEKYW